MTLRSNFCRCAGSASRPASSNSSRGARVESDVVCPVVLPRLQPVAVRAHPGVKHRNRLRTLLPRRRDRNRLTRRSNSPHDNWVGATKRKLGFARSDQHTVLPDPGDQGLNEMGNNEPTTIIQKAAAWTCGNCSCWSRTVWRRDPGQRSVIDSDAAERLPHHCEQQLQQQLRDRLDKQGCRLSLLPGGRELHVLRLRERHVPVRGQWLPERAERVSWPPDTGQAHHEQPQRRGYRWRRSVGLRALLLRRSWLAASLERPSLWL